jgi:hypothetical protein
MQFLRDAALSIWLGPAVAVFTLAMNTVITALRPAGDREVLLRGLPPRDYPLSSRLIQLWFNLGREAKRQTVTAGWLGIAMVVVGSVAALSVHADTKDAVAAVALFTVFTVVSWYLIASVMLLGRYLGTRRRLVREAQVTLAAIETAFDE